MLFPAGHKIWYGKKGEHGLIKTLSKPLYRSQAKEWYGDLSDDELKKRFIEDWTRIW